MLAAHLPAKSSPMTMVGIVDIGGAFAEVPDEATAFAGRHSTRFAIAIDALAPDAESLAADRAWVRSLYDALRPFSPDGAAYDPDNIFHRNPNVTPAH